MNRATLLTSITNTDISHLLSTFGFPLIQLPLSDKERAAFLKEKRDEVLASPEKRRHATVSYRQKRKGRKALEPNTLQYMILALLDENGITKRCFISPRLNADCNEVDRAAYSLKERGCIARPIMGLWEATPQGKVALYYAELEDMATNPDPEWPKKRARLKHIQKEPADPYFINSHGHQYAEEAIQTRLLLALWEQSNKHITTPSASETAKQYMSLMALAVLAPELRETELRKMMKALSTKNADSQSLIGLKVRQGFYLNDRGIEAVRDALEKTAPHPNASP